MVAKEGFETKTSYGSCVCVCVVCVGVLETVNVAGVLSVNAFLISLFEMLFG